jgi:hypothetical protein
MRYVQRDGAYIEYRLNLLGVRVTATNCQLVARSPGTTESWETIGPKRPLPLEIPTRSESLQSGSADALRVTVWQYDIECPGSDIREVLSQRNDFLLALENGSSASKDADARDVGPIV